MVVLTLNLTLTSQKSTETQGTDDVMNSYGKFHENLTSTFREITSAGMLIN